MGRIRGTGRNLADHWTWAARAGHINPNTANALRAAVVQVLSVEEGWEGLAVREIDAERVLRKFERLRGADFSPGSLVTYRSRFKKALRLYLEYLDDPAGWDPSGRARSAPTSGSRRATASEHASTPGNLIEYPFPLRPGVVIRIELPVDLTNAEARRLGAFLEALASEPEAIQDQSLKLPPPPSRRHSSSEG